MVVGIETRSRAELRRTHDAYTSSEIQTYEDLGLCQAGEGGVRERHAICPIDYGLELPKQGRLRSILPVDCWPAATVGATD